MYKIIFRYVKRGKFRVRTYSAFYLWYGVWWVSVTMDVKSVTFDTSRDDFIHIFIFSSTGDLFYCSMF